jgi:hypothetical protein
MAKIIGHYFDEVGEYSTFSVSGLQETANLYVRTNETLSNAPDTMNNWEALNKCHLGRLLPAGNGVFAMYALQEDLPRFEQKVAAALFFRQNVRIAAWKG